MRLPDDLRTFLESNGELEYASDECECGEVTLASLENLVVRMYPTDVDNADFDNSADPHRGEMGCYLVPGVSLLSDCAEYDADGLLIWLPDEGAYGTWDSSHCLVEKFGPDVTWTTILTDPLSILHSFWGDNDERMFPMFAVVPWGKYEYSPTQLHRPQRTGA